MERNDSEELARYRRGDPEGLEALVEKYRSPLFSFLVNMTGSEAEANDVFQEVWLRVIHKHRLFIRGHFYGWLVRMARNIVVDRARRRKPEISLDQTRDDGSALVERLAGTDRGPAKHAEAEEIRARVRRAVAGLPEAQREVFLMRVEAGLPFREIARIQKVSIGTALARMQYAADKLRGQLRNEWKEWKT